MCCLDWQCGCCARDWWRQASPPNLHDNRTLPAPQLDAGVPEQVLLMSRDEQSMLVASYADIKVRCGRQGRRLTGASRGRRISRAAQGKLAPSQSELLTGFCAVAGGLARSHPACPSRPALRPVPPTPHPQRCVESAYAELRSVSRLGGR